MLKEDGNRADKHNWLSDTSCTESTSTQLFVQLPTYNLDKCKVRIYNAEVWLDKSVFRWVNNANIPSLLLHVEWNIIFRCSKKVTIVYELFHIFQENFSFWRFNLKFQEYIGKTGCGRVYSKSENVLVFTFSFSFAPSIKNLMFNVLRIRSYC